jgi:hypothetical protein
MPRPFMLWLVVTLLWTSATLLAIHRRWPQISDARNAFDNPLPWLCLLLPPAMFATMIAVTVAITPR